MRILLAEDDPLLGDGLRAGLRQLGFQVDWVRDGVAAERELLTAQHQAAVLDIGLPRRDGLAVLQTVRARGVAMPVLVLTARDAVAHRIEGLNLGADDYVVKPVGVLEFLARVEALLDENPAWRERIHPEAPYLAAEVVLAVRDEMARTVDDVVRRRMPLSLIVRDAPEWRNKVAVLMAEARQAPAA